MADMVGLAVLDDLPESIVVEEILVRLSPKDILRCRAVRRSWRTATSTPKFIHDNHRRQPSLPILRVLSRDDMESLAVFRDDKLRPFLRRTDSLLIFHGVCDGLVVVSHDDTFYICNPATRKCTMLPCSRWGLGTTVLAVYQHHPSGEYRVLWVSRGWSSNSPTDFFVLGMRAEPPEAWDPKDIEWPPVLSPSMEQAMSFGFPYQCVYPSYQCGNLHWQLGNYFGNTVDYLLVFDTAAEVFRTMRFPTQLGPWAWLSNIDSSTLALFSYTDDHDVVSEQLTLHIWVVQDYKAETWTCRHRINLSPTFKASLPFDITGSRFPMVAVVNERELLFKFDHLLLRCDIDGKLVGKVVEPDDDNEVTCLYKLHLQESLTPLTSDGILEDAFPQLFVGL